MLGSAVRKSLKRRGPNRSSRTTNNAQRSPTMSRVDEYAEGRQQKRRDVDDEELVVKEREGQRDRPWCRVGADHHVTSRTSV